MAAEGYVQLELFPLTEAEQLRLELDKVKDELANVRRGIFARQNQLAADIVKLRSDIDTILCHDKVDTNLTQIK